MCTCTCMLNISEHSQSDKLHTSRKKKNAHFGQIHYKIYVFGSAHMKFRIGINASPQAQLAISQSKLN